MKLTKDNVIAGLRVKITRRQFDEFSVGRILEVTDENLEAIKKTNPKMTIEKIKDLPYFLSIQGVQFCLVNINDKRLAVAVSRVWIIPEKLTDDQKSNIDNLISNLNDKFNASNS